MRRLLGLILLLALCANAGPNWKAMSKSQRRATLDKIASRCHLSRSVFVLRAGDDLHFQPSPKAKYKSVECALTGLERIQGLGKMGFIGSEAYTLDPKTKASE